MLVTKSKTNAVTCIFGTQVQNLGSINLSETAMMLGRSYAEKHDSLLIAVLTFR